MIVYKGSASETFQIKKHKKSRYGFRALFFASHLFLARLYATSDAEDEFMENGGFVHEFEIEDCEHTINFRGQSTYNSAFRKMVYDLHQQGYKSVRIKGVVDYPSKKYAILNSSDVIIVFDFSVIKSWKLIERNVKVRK